MSLEMDDRESRGRKSRSNCAAIASFSRHSFCGRLSLIGMTILSLACFATTIAADEPTATREVLLEQMRALAKATDVRLVNSDRQAQQVADPIFRYDDQPRRFVDATIWAWTDRGRPVAFQKIEALDYGEAATTNQLWQYCLASLTTETVMVNWPGGQKFRSQKPGVEFRAVNESPAVAEASAQRKRQARELIRTFSARIFTDIKNNTQQEMRLLTTPLFEYSDPATKSFLGAAFGFSTNGTNPDLIVLIEAREDGDKLAWHFAPARMTTGAVTLKRHDTKVWECESADSRRIPLLTWTFFTTPRTALPEGDKP